MFLSRSGGIKVQGISMAPVQRHKYQRKAILEGYLFVPHNTVLSIQHSVRVNAQLILENLLPVKLSCVELTDNHIRLNPIALSPILTKVFDEEKTVQVDIKIYSNEDLDIENVPVERGNISNDYNKYAIVIASKLLENAQVCIS